MKTVCYVLTLLLLVVSLCGCQQQVSAASDGDTLNKAFVQSELSEYAVDDTLFIIEPIGSEINAPSATDIEKCNEDIEHSGYWAIIPRFKGSSLLVEWMVRDADLVQIPNKVFESTSTDSYVLLFKDKPSDTLMNYYLMTVTHNGVSSSYSFQMDGKGGIEYPYVTGGYILNM